MYGHHGVASGQSEEMLGGGSSGSFGGGSPFESFDSQIESDVMSSLSSCPHTSDGSATSTGLLGTESLKSLYCRQS